MAHCLRARRPARAPAGGIAFTINFSGRNSSARWIAAAGRRRHERTTAASAWLSSCTPASSTSPVATFEPARHTDQPVARIIVVDAGPAPPALTDPGAQVLRVSTRSVIPRLWSSTLTGPMTGLGFTRSLSLSGSVHDNSAPRRTDFARKRSGPCLPCREVRHGWSQKNSWPTNRTASAGCVHESQASNSPAVRAARLRRGADLVRGWIS
jgi:hypothetical protein